MRIVYLHQYFNTPQMIGGTRSYEMARRLVAMGHDVQLVTTRRDPDTPHHGHWSSTDESGVQVHWLPVPYSNHMPYAERLKAFSRFAWHASTKAAALGGDVIFATSTPLTIALPGVYAARRARVPMVLEVRDLWPEVPIALGAVRNPAMKAAARWLEGFAYRHANRIVALSPDMKTGIQQRGYPAERVTVIPNASDLDLFDVGPEPGQALRQRFPWLQDRPLVLYAGTLGLVNGVSYLARMAAEVKAVDPEVRFVVIGEGREEHMVRRTAADLDVLDQTFFMLPSVPKKEIPAWLSAADVGTSVVIDVPALWANCANKVFDTWAAGTPVVINHEGWLAELIRETDSGLVLPARDPRAAAQTLVAALHDRSWRARAQAAAHRLANERFSRDRLVELLAAVLADAVDEASRVGVPSTLRRYGTDGAVAADPAERMAADGSRGWR